MAFSFLPLREVEGMQLVGGKEGGWGMAAHTRLLTLVLALGSQERCLTAQQSTVWPSAGADVRRGVCRS